jgi:hypothetical protein
LIDNFRKEILLKSHPLRFPQQQNLRSLETTRKAFLLRPRSAVAHDQTRIRAVLITGFTCGTRNDCGHFPLLTKLADAVTAAAH